MNGKNKHVLLHINDCQTAEFFLPVIHIHAGFQFSNLYVQF
jgi:hypothetical protein